MRLTTWMLASCALGSLLAPLAQAQNEQAARMETALLSPNRPLEDKARDAARKPIQTVQFLGIKTGDTVIDVIAAGGWFTEVLSAAVGPSGKVLAQNPDFFVSQPNFSATEKARHDRHVTPMTHPLSSGSPRPASAGSISGGRRAVHASGYRPALTGLGEPASVLTAWPTRSPSLPA